MNLGVEFIHGGILLSCTTPLTAIRERGDRTNTQRFKAKTRPWKLTLQYLRNLSENEINQDFENLIY